MGNLLVLQSSAASVLCSLVVSSFVHSHSLPQYLQLSASCDVLISVIIRSFIAWVCVSVYVSLIACTRSCVGSFMCVLVSVVICKIGILSLSRVFM